MSTTSWQYSLLSNFRSTRLFTSFKEVSPLCSAHAAFTSLIPTQTWTLRLPLGINTLFFPDHFFQFIKIYLNCSPSFQRAGCPHTSNTCINFTCFNEHVEQNWSEDGAQSVSPSILTPEKLPLQSPWFRYAFLCGPFIHLPHSESHLAGDLGCGVKAQISKQYVILPHLTVYFPSPIVFLCPVALCIKAIRITLSHVEGEVTVTHTTMLFCSPFGAVLPSACPHSWLSPQKAATINQTSE